MTEQPILITSITADNNLVKHSCVGFDGEAIAEGEPCLGIVNADTVQGEQCPVIVSGIALVTSGGAINKGRYVKSGDDGCIDAGIGPTFDTTIIGVALDSASGSGELIRVLLK